MAYFKNVELASRYNISESTVRNWVRLAKEGRLGIILAHTRGRSYVANVDRNISIIEKLVEENRKYRNSRSLKTISPQPKFYKLFTPSQIYDIVRSLDLYHEIPRYYSFIGKGADMWDEYAIQLIHQDQPNLLNTTIEMLNTNRSYIDNHIAKYKRVNVIDVGVGNVMPAKPLLDHLSTKGVLGKYIAIDISQRMLEIAQRNVKAWFGDKVPFEGYQRDITFEHFSDVVAGDYLNGKTDDSINLFLLLGATPTNFRNPDDAFHTINKSMNPNDLLFYTDKLETEEMLPEWYNYDYEDVPEKFAISPRHRLVLDLIGIDDSFYEAEVSLNRQKNLRYVQARLKVALTLRFDFDDGERILEFEKGDTILLWRSWQMTASSLMDQLDRTGFYVLHSSQTEDHEYILTIADVKRG